MKNIICFLYFISLPVLAQQKSQPITISGGVSYMLKATPCFQHDRLTYDVNASVLLVGDAGRKNNVNLYLGFTYNFRPGVTVGQGVSFQMLGLAPSGERWHLGGGLEAGYWSGPRETLHWGLPLVARYIAPSGLTIETQIVFGFAPGMNLLVPSRGTGYTNTRFSLGWSF